MSGLTSANKKKSQERFYCSFTKKKKKKKKRRQVACICHLQKYSRKRKTSWIESKVQHMETP